MKGPVDKLNAYYCERSQSEKVTYCMIPKVYILYKILEKTKLWR